MSKSQKPNRKVGKDNKQRQDPVQIANIKAFVDKLKKQIAKRTGAIIMLLYQFADNGKMSGRREGNVLMRNGRGRGMVVPALVQNAYTSAVRTLLATLSTGWEALDDSDRASWNNMSWLFKSNRFGVSKQVKGKSAYVALNSNIALVAGSPITTAPADSGGVDNITSADLVADQSSDTMEINFGPSPTTMRGIVFATPVMPAGVSRPKASAFRMIMNFNTGVATPMDIKTAYNDKYGDSWQTDGSLNGKKIFVKLKVVNDLTGASGSDIIGVGTIST